MIQFTPLVYLYLHIWMHETKPAKCEQGTLRPIMNGDRYSGPLSQIRSDRCLFTHNASHRRRYVGNRTTDNTEDIHAEMKGNQKHEKRVKKKPRHECLYKYKVKEREYEKSPKHFFPCIPCSMRCITPNPSIRNANIFSKMTEES